MSELNQPAPLPFASLTVIDDPAPHPAGLNMALDEVLLSNVASGAILRCYRWSERSASFGCFGPVASVRREYPRHALVRRWTGGGIVDHVVDFAFTLLVSRQQLLTAVRARESYRLVHLAVAGALSQVITAQVDTTLSAGSTASSEGLKAPHLKACFAHPVAHDLMVGGRKVAGGAQRRTRDGLLHQGSIQGLFGLEGPAEETRRALSQALGSALGSATVTRAITSGELASADELAKRKYDSPAWLERC